MNIQKALFGEQFQVQELHLTTVKFYLIALLFTAGNVILPTIFHTFQLGGRTFLPIYFFILIGSYLYSWRIGLIVAIASPLINHSIAGMPPAIALPMIIVKGMLLALFAGFIAQYGEKLSLVHVAGAVIGYQLIGSIIETVVTGSFTQGFTDVLIGYPGMLIQIFLGYFLIKMLAKTDKRQTNVKRA